VQASFVSPTIFASKINQFNNGGSENIMSNIIETLKEALKLLVLMFLLSLSKILTPENSILIK
jgi:hypothetical protein